MRVGEHLRPIERVTLRLAAQDISSVEIGRKIGKKPGTVERILRMIEYKEGRTGSPAKAGQTLRPIERVIRRLRAAGESYGEIGNRLGKSGAQVRRIEAYAEMKT